MTTKDNSLQLSIEVKDNVGFPGGSRHHTIHLQPKYHAYGNTGAPRTPSDLSCTKITRHQSSEREVIVYDQPDIVAGKVVRNSNTYLLPRGRWSEVLSDEARAWRRAHGSSPRRSLTPHPYKKEPNGSDPRFHRTIHKECTLAHDGDDVSDNVPAGHIPPSLRALGTERGIEKIVPTPDELVTIGDKDEAPLALPKSIALCEKCHKGVQTQREASTKLWDLSRLHHSRSLRKVESESSLDQLVIRCRSDHFVKEQLGSREPLVNSLDQLAIRCRPDHFVEEQQGSSAHLEDSREGCSDDRLTNTSNHCCTPSSISLRKLCTRHKRTFSGQASEKYVSGTYFVMSLAAIAISATFVAIQMLDIIPMMCKWIF